MAHCLRRLKDLLEEPGGFSLSQFKSEAETIDLRDRKPVIDVALRGRMLHLLSSQSTDDVKALLKMCVAAALANICSAPTPFLLFADVFNTKPISVCQELFGFMEETITTLKDLLDLQLMDLSFRRYIMVQLLLVFQYLSTPTRFKTPDQVLSDEQADWVNRKREAVLRLLSGNKTHTSANQARNSFVSTVERILDRETFWNRWKNEGCPSFVRSPEEPPTNPRKRRVNPLVDRTGNRIFRFGNKNLDRLWNVCPDNLAACRDERRLFRPNLLTYFQDAILELDPAEKVEEEYKSVNKEEWCWRALRCLSSRSTHFYINWNPPGRPVKDYLTIILTEKLQLEEERKNARATDMTAPVLPIKDIDHIKADPSPAKQSRLASPVSLENTLAGDNPRIRKSGKTENPNSESHTSSSGTLRRTPRKGSAVVGHIDTFDQEDAILEDELTPKLEDDGDLHVDKYSNVQEMSALSPDKSLR